MCSRTAAFLLQCVVGLRAPEPQRPRVAVDSDICAFRPAHVFVSTSTPIDQTLCSYDRQKRAFFDDSRNFQ